MRLSHFFVVFIAAMLFCAAACAFTASYEQTTTGTGLPGPQTQSIKIDGSKIRVEMDTPEGRAVTIINGDEMYSYILSQNKAMKMTGQRAFDMDVLSDYGSYLESLNAKVVGSEKIGRYDCDIYEFKDPKANMTSKVWLWKGKEFPVKVENKLPHGAITTVMENVKIGIKIDNAEFTLPPGVEVITR